MGTRTLYTILSKMAAKALRRASKPRSAKRAAARATRRAARKARRAPKPKAPKTTKRAVRRTQLRKPKRVTRAMQTGSYRKVWNGSSKFTKGGLVKADLMLNKRGKVVSKKQFASGEKLKSGGWTAAVIQARKELGITGFCTINRGAKGVALYKRAKKLHK